MNPSDNPLSKGWFSGEIFKPSFGFTRIKLQYVTRETARDKKGNTYTWHSYKAYWRKDEVSE